MTDVHVTLAPGVSGDLSSPDRPLGLVLLVGSHDGHRERARLRAISGYLRRRQYATLRLGPPDLDAPGPEPEPSSTPGEDDARLVPPLAHRLLQALGGLPRHPALAALPVGVFGAGLGAAAAIDVAAERPDAVRAVVSQSGRLDLAGPSLSALKAPLLLVVGGYDTALFDLAREASRTPGLSCRLEVVPRATQLFEEAGALERVALSAADWYDQHLRAAG